MKIRFITGLFLLFPFLGFPQGENNIWYFGKRAGMDFNSGSPVALTNCSSGWSDFTYLETAAVSDSLGNLLFYANCEIVFDRNHNMMPNGNIYASNEDVDQPVFIVKKMDDDSSYYLFTMDYPLTSMYPNAKGLCYSVIDMRLNGGFGDVIAGQKNIPVPAASQTALVLGGTRHYNNQDVWLAVRKYSNSYQYLTYLINSAGINPVPVVSNSFLLTIAGPPDWNNLPDVIKFSPDGKKLVCTYDTVAEFCGFNSETGVITPLFLFVCAPPFNGFYRHGCEFSIDSKYLYVHANVNSGENSYNKIVQFDATKTDSAQFKQSEILIAYDQGKNDLRLAPDGKIYITDDRNVSGPPWPPEGVDSLAVINNPSAQGLACNYQANAFYLNGRRSYSGFPQFLQRYYLYIHHNGQCQMKGVDYSSTLWPPADSVHWDFGDPDSGPSNFSNLNNPTHVYSSAGSFTVTLFVRHIDKRTDTAWQVVTILPGPELDLGLDKTVCMGDSITFDAGFCVGCTYQWSDLTNGLMNIGNNQTYTAHNAAQYKVSVTGLNNCPGADTVVLSLSPVPDVTNSPLTKVICTGESTNIALTSNVPGATFDWTATLTSGNITGFSADAGMEINQALIDNSATPGVVTYHITPKVGNCVGVPVDFSVTVTPGDSVKVSITASENNICAETMVTFTATSTNAGTTPVYQWKVNGINAGTDSTSFLFTPMNSDNITCELTSSLSVCISNNPATSNGITMAVNPKLPVSVSISASANPFCPGSPVTLTATPGNGGTAPFYQWKVNGINVGNDSSNFTYNPANGDLVSCILTSSEVCTANNPASSIQYLMTAIPGITAGVTIASISNPFCPGSSVLFTATPANGGPTPFYQWNVNGINAGTNSSIFTYIPVNNDSVSCVMMSNLSCVNGNPASSNRIIMSGTFVPSVSFSSCFDTITTVDAKPIKLKGGVPLGGTYSGPGVDSLTGIFIPAIAGAGIQTITYTYRTAALCSASKSISILNLPPCLFSCGNPLTDPRDNKVYQTVQIGSQCWLAANLNYGTILSSSQDQRDNCVAEKYCYNDSPINCMNHGGLYQWDELMLFDENPAGQGFCPPGWHIPTENEWNTLFANYMNNGVAGSPLKYSGYSGFNALFSGARYINIDWGFQGFATFFWSSTQIGTVKAWAHGLNKDNPSVSGYPASRADAFSVRCLKD